MKHHVDASEWLFHTQPPPKPNVTGKQAALTLLEGTRRRHITLGRIAFAKALLARSEATADDAWDAFPFGVGDLNPVFLGCIPTPFARARFICKNGLIQSVRMETHAREITRWQLLDRAGVETLLAQLEKEVD